MSVLTTKAKAVKDMPVDEVYVIYGLQGTGKTVLASTFPKTKEKPMLYLDILEGGTGSISYAERENIEVVPITSFEEINEVFKDVINGYTVDDSGKKIPVAYSTIVIDTATQLEFLLKKGLMENAKKDQMTLQLWGYASQEHDEIWNAARTIHQTTGTRVVVLCHQKEISDEENPGNNKIIPSLMSKAAYGLCAKASFVWYTKIEEVTTMGADGKAKREAKYYTYIDGCQAYLSKTRKPKEMKIPLKIANLTYKKFKANILDTIAGPSPTGTTTPVAPVNETSIPNEPLKEEPKQTESKGE